jgi:hypothetical protein
MCTAVTAVEASTSRRKSKSSTSSAKFRRKLEKAAAEIAATEKRLTAAEKAYFTGLDFIEREPERIS